MAKMFMLALAVLMMPGATVPGFAQATSDDSFAGLADHLRPGDRVSVRGAGFGTATGRLRDLTSDALVVETDEGLRTLAAADIDRIDRRRKGVLLGTLIGLGAGVAAALPIRELLRNEGHDATTAVLALVGGGTAVGFAIDYAVDLPRTVYTREGRVAFHIEPSPLPGGATVRLHARY
jgi:hypothetical protein